MNNIKGKPAYWKNVLLEVSAIFRNFGLLSFFKDSKWNEITLIVSKFNRQELSSKNATNIVKNTVISSNFLLWKLGEITVFVAVQLIIL